MRPGGCPGAGGPPRSGGCSCLGRLGLVIDPQACCINKRDATYPGKHFLSWEVRRKEEGARTLSSMPDLGRGLHGVGVTGTGLHGCQGSHRVSLGMGLRGCQGPHGVSLGTGLRGYQRSHRVSLGMGSPGKATLLPSTFQQKLRKPRASLLVGGAVRNEYGAGGAQIPAMWK